jgi:hypothetical protein
MLTADEHSSVTSAELLRNPAAYTHIIAVVGSSRVLSSAVSEGVILILLCRGRGGGRLVCCARSLKLLGV